jgi:hypothetical protein
VIVADAAAFELPLDVTTIYFNPFAGESLERVLKNIALSYEEAPRSMRLVCNLPRESAFESIVDQSRFLRWKQPSSWEQSADVACFQWPFRLWLALESAGEELRIRLMLFSVVIPSYNRANLLPRAIASVREQQFTDFEIIVVDDGSKDGTRERLQGLDRSRSDKGGGIGEPTPRSARAPS